MLRKTEVLVAVKQVIKIHKVLELPVKVTMVQHIARFLVLLQEEEAQEAQEGYLQCRLLQVVIVD